MCIYPLEFIEKTNPTPEDKEVFPTSNSLKLKNYGKYGKGVFALRSFEKGALIGSFTGIVGTEIKQHTLQLAPGSHIYDPYFIGFMLHSCDPNARLDMGAKRLFCIKNIKVDESITVDYTLTENVLFKQFSLH